MKYVAWHVNGECTGWTSKSNFDKNVKAIQVEHYEDVVEFEAPEYDDTDSMFEALKCQAHQVCAEAIAKNTESCEGLSAWEIRARGL